MSTKSNAAMQKPFKEEAMNSSHTKHTSVKNEWKLLAQAHESPASILDPVRTMLLSALQSQAGLASLEIPELNIVGMSLNTHKAIAADCIEGGYSALNDYRRAALERLRAAKLQAEQPKRGTLIQLKDELEATTAKLERTTNEVAKMGKQLKEFLDVSYEMAKAAGKEAEFIKSRNELLRKFK